MIKYNQEDINKVVGYLATKPYQEVFHLIDLLMKGERDAKNGVERSE